jgi:hypothetical protein
MGGIMVILVKLLFLHGSKYNTVDEWTRRAAKTTMWMSELEVQQGRHYG